MGANQRIYERIDAEDSQLLGIIKDHSGPGTPCDVINFSERGACLWSLESPKEGREVNLELITGQRSEKYQGLVKWVKELETSGYLIGLETKDEKLFTKAIQSIMSRDRFELKSIKAATGT
ncbi:hypothetical protein [Pseudobacteriovorax antillogorgiicola]|uniref:PilZ domain-containing protein n=1 Tax=Pseudobacteriovorax antillogorgiicola TaxID=1513793 RepID=A0A1Y6BHJ3_9BACT|nr:hypothetical protein [Pseudobacteriovorax antillogorgiicola]TCS55506.1 hypothetical protein EDD56_105229 [Pseudobacteriovorax antillogorgiicola]SMF11539.1 hypothetical protein SAMN06296036_10595 [Pseudobacteriovorax antillogorgiicola]